MNELIHTIKQIDLSKVQGSDYSLHFVGCIVISHDNKIILQQRGSTWRSNPGALSTFGGKVETEESPKQALIRELNEELGAIVDKSDIINIGAFTEEYTNHRELVYGYFWKDIDNSITGCYEGEAMYFETSATCLEHPKIMDDVKWLLSECKARQLLV